ncbi:Major facilitator superfamily multidrug-resistance DHA1 sub-family [Mycena venus]|uniref:Major facilitator superfamily multidrug-resistance DHA1 sub-family n=1 Tax=Mycena venus TaxID=2733690 RepID=A0A8H7CAP4_9AGAR|nr:Major facilitator superfamily multidrug-resistance DHA1 sub-family [Mycena venus]
MRFPVGAEVASSRFSSNECIDKDLSFCFYHPIFPSSLPNTWHIDDERSPMSDGTNSETETLQGSTTPRERTPLPKLQLFILLFIQFSEPVTALVIYPFIMQFVRDTNITGGDETKTGYFAGIIESVFFLAECLTVVYFGRASDRYGRRPVLLFGPVGLALSMLGFGLSKRFWSLVVFRCMQGAFNGNIGVSKSVMAEAIYRTPPTSQKYIHFFPSCGLWAWQSGMCFVLSPGHELNTVASPFIGGTLANPAVRYPDTLGKIHIFREFPYLLPCATAGALALGAFVFGFLGLKETLPSAVARQKKALQGTEVEPLLSDTNDSPPTNATADEVPPLRDLFIRPVLIALLNHAFLCFCQMSYDVMIPLVPLYIGRIMGLCGFLNIFTQTFLSAKAIRRFGPRSIFITAFCCLSFSFLAYPFLNFFARKAGRVDASVIIVIILQMSSSFVIFPTYACTQMFIVDSAPTQNSLGGVNGLAQMVSSILRSIAPSLAASLFSTSVSYHLLGGNFVFFVLCAISLCGVRCALLLPKKLRSEDS